MRSTGGGRIAPCWLFRAVRVPWPTETTHVHTTRRMGRHDKKKEAIPIKKLNRSLTDQVFGIGRYRYSKDGQLYFVHGKTRIKVTEHFHADGKALHVLLEDVIQFSAKQREDKIRPAC